MKFFNEEFFYFVVSKANALSSINILESLQKQVVKKTLSEI